MSLYQQGVTLKSLLENPDLLNPPKKTNDGKKDADDAYNAQSAFLGPTLWDKTVPYDGITAGDLDDFKLEFMDLDEFLTENEILDTNPAPAPVPAPQQQQQQQASPVSRVTVQNTSPVMTPVNNPVTQTPEDMSPGNEEENQDCESSRGSSYNDYAMWTTEEGQDDFDPRKRAFTDEELRPQPLIKKSKKIFVPDDAKDDKYWCRRKKNNVAAKRSRDARRIKENQIAMRASFLEKQNLNLRAELEKVMKENVGLKERLAKYEPETS